MTEEKRTGHHHYWVAGSCCGDGPHCTCPMPTAKCKFCSAVASQSILEEIIEDELTIAEKDKEIARLRDDNKKLSARYLLELVKEVRAENKRLSTLLERRTRALRNIVNNIETWSFEVIESEARQALQDDGKGER